MLSYRGFIALLAALLLSPEAYAQSCTSHSECSALYRGRCINGSCASTSCTETDNPCPPASSRCDFSIGNCVPIDISPDPNPPINVPEMSETLALGFVAAAGGLLLYIRKRRGPR